MFYFFKILVTIFSKIFKIIYICNEIYYIVKYNKIVQLVNKIVSYFYVLTFDRSTVKSIFIGIFFYFMTDISV